MALTEEQWQRLASEAWAALEHAHLYGSTAVGAAAQAEDGHSFAACNVEHRFRSHDIHAEVNAVGSMISTGRTRLVAIIVVARRERFTPCGACMDWIFEFGGADCEVGYQNSPDGPITVLTSRELMPHYPI